MTVRGAIEVVLAGDPADARFTALVQVVNDRYLPSLVLVGGSKVSAEGLVLLDGRSGDVPQAYVCRNRSCDLPTGDPVELARQLDAIVSRGTR